MTNIKQSQTFTVALQQMQLLIYCKLADAIPSYAASAQDSYAIEGCLYNPDAENMTQQYFSTGGRGGDQFHYLMF